MKLLHRFLAARRDRCNFKALSTKKTHCQLLTTGLCRGVSNRVRTGDLRNHNPADSGSKCLSSPEVTATCATVGPQVGQKPGRDDSTGDDFSAAVMAIMRLPLSDSEKTEAVQRMLQSQRHQDRHNRSN